jgi:putative ABC transport system permease protein
MALGAAPGRVLAQVLSQYLMLAAAGIATGLAIAWARSRFVGELLVAVSPTDVRVYAAVALLTLAAAALAALAPARRAAARAALRADGRTSSGRGPRTREPVHR